MQSPRADASKQALSLQTNPIRVIGGSPPSHAAAGATDACSWTRTRTVVAALAVALVAGVLIGVLVGLSDEIFGDKDSDPVADTATPENSGARAPQVAATIRLAGVPLATFNSVPGVAAAIRASWAEATLADLDDVLVERVEVPSRRLQGPGRTLQATPLLDIYLVLLLRHLAANEWAEEARVALGAAVHANTTTEAFISLVQTRVRAALDAAGPGEDSATISLDVREVEVVGDLVVDDDDSAGGGSSPSPSAEAPSVSPRASTSPSRSPNPSPSASASTVATPPVPSTSPTASSSPSMTPSRTASPSSTPSSSSPPSTPASPTASPSVTPSVSSSSSPSITPSPSVSSSSSPSITPSPSVSPSATPTPSLPPRVLMIVANDGFYFQEYFDPRTELERLGFAIDVASGLGGDAVPHPGSYNAHKNASNDFEDGVVPAAEDDRIVRGTQTLASTEASEYAGLVVSGGWGASRYYLAYPGVFDGSISQWAPVPAQAAEVSRLLQEFLEQGKPVLGVCNGVNVLGWARISGASVLQNRTASAPWGSSFPHQYPNPYPSGPLTSYGSSWTVDGACPAEPTASCFPMDKMARDNGALLEDFGTRSSPQSPVRDEAVSVDGLVLTAQDNFAARVGARKLASQICAHIAC